LTIGDVVPITPAATRLRDRAFLVGPAVGPIGGWLASVDPFSGDVETHRFPYPLPPIGFLDVAGMDEPGVLALCTIGVLDDLEHVLELSVLAPDGSPIGASVRISNEARIHCAVGAHGETIFVAWPISHLDVVRVQGYRLRR
jgi:hypothetical protein